jgi:hypothetical protein
MAVIIVTTKVPGSSRVILSRRVVESVADPRAPQPPDRSRLEVAIVPPDTEAALAEHALRAAGLDGDATLGPDVVTRANLN